jgi:lipopolysaccharide biosynthesis glycosyltransferase
MKTVSIYTCHHKPSAFLDSSVIKPIHVGKANSLNVICCDGDDTGDNISYKNPFYCELTAHYWVWKNAIPTDYVGFMHYRRHFNFSDDQHKPEDNWGMVNCDEINQEYQEEFGLNEKQILKLLENVDLIVPCKWSVKSAGSKNNYHHYKVSDHLHIKDYQSAIDVLLRKHPEYYSAVKTFNAAADGYYTNMYVMNKPLFDEYSTWLFGILEELEEEIAFENYSAQEKRVIGHISERLFNIFIIFKLASQNLRIKEVQRTFIKNETFNGKLGPHFTERNVPIVICSDDNYAMSLGALVNSIVKNASTNHNYDIVVLDNGLSQRNKERVKNLVANTTNMNVRYFDINAFKEIKDAYIRPPFTAATYSRLFIPKLFRDFSKVLFIDTDTVVESDLAELIETPLGNNLVAAVQDIVMEGFVKFGNVAQSDAGVQTAEEYLKTRLEMANTDNYFQGGIIVFNIAQMNEENIFEKLMTALKGQSYWFLDQDIMNKVFYNRVHFLPLDWNVYHGNGHTDVFYPNLKFSTYMRFLNARQNPKMIHFAGENKPWNTDKVDFYDNFIKNIQGTPWEREVYGRLMGAHTSVPSTEVSLQPILFRTKIKNRLMPHVNRFAPRGSKRRTVIAKCYYKFRRVVLG